MNIKNQRKLILPLIAFIGILLASCGGVDYKAIDKKIEENGIEAEFSENEYSAMLDYVEKYVEKQLPKANKDYNPDSNQDRANWDKQMDEAGQIFLYLAAVSTAAENGKLDATNRKRFNNVMKSLQSLSE